MVAASSTSVYFGQLYLPHADKGLPDLKHDVGKGFIAILLPRLKRDDYVGYGSPSKKKASPQKPRGGKKRGGGNLQQGNSSRNSISNQ